MAQVAQVATDGPRWHMGMGRHLRSLGEHPGGFVETGTPSKEAVRGTRERESTVFEAPSL